MPYRRAHTSALVFTLSVLVCSQFPLAAQSQTGTVRIHVRSQQTPIENAEVVVGGASRPTDASGTATVVATAGNVDVTVVKPGFVPLTTSVQLGAGATQEVVVEL